MMNNNSISEQILNLSIQMFNAGIQAFNTGKNMNMMMNIQNSYNKLKKISEQINSIISEYERLRFLNAKRHKDNITIYIRKFSDCITDFHVSLADRLTEFSEMKEVDTTQTVQLDKNEIIDEQKQNNE